MAVLRVVIDVAGSCVAFCVALFLVFVSVVRNPAAFCHNFVCCGSGCASRSLSHRRRSHVGFLLCAQVADKAKAKAAVSSEELARRQEVMRAQRELLLKKKNQER